LAEVDSGFGSEGNFATSALSSFEIGSPFFLSSSSLSLHFQMASFSEQLFNNATILVKGFVAETQLRNHDLYSGLDLSQLNWLEQSWAAWYNYWGSPILATGILSFVMHEVRRFPFPFELEELLTIRLSLRSSTSADACHGCSSTTWAGSRSTSCKTCVPLLFSGNPAN
jgi:hypothetical protein